MSELISKQTAIDAVMDEFKRIPTNAIRAKIRIEALPPAQPEPCEDAVSRAEVLRMIDCINDHQAITPYKSIGAVTEHLTRIASSLPPVTPEQRTGRWIAVDSYTAYGGDKVTWMAHGNPVVFHYCSACKEHAYAGEDGDDILSNYCPHCGAKMNKSDKTCDCYSNGRCVGTKEIDSCSCGGNKSKCDFYENVRREGEAE